MSPLVLYADALADWEAWDEQGHKWEFFDSSGSWRFACSRCGEVHWKGWLNVQTREEVCLCCVMITYDFARVMA